MSRIRQRPRLIRLTALIAVLVLAAAGVLWWVFVHDGDKRVVAYFNRTVGVYEGSDVRALGVAIGRVESVTPQGGGRSKSCSEWTLRFPFPRTPTRWWSPPAWWPIATSSSPR